MRPVSEELEMIAAHLGSSVLSHLATGVAELEAKAAELEAIKSEPVPEWEPNFAGMLDKYKELLHPYGYKCSPARQQLIDYVTALEAKAALAEQLPEIQMLADVHLGDGDVLGDAARAIVEQLKSLRLYTDGE